MKRLIEKLKVCWNVLTKRNYIYFGLSSSKKEPFIYDKKGYFVETKKNAIAAYSSIEDMCLYTDDDKFVHSLDTLLWEAVSDFAEKQITESRLKN